MNVEKMTQVREPFTCEIHTRSFFPFCMVCEFFHTFTTGSFLFHVKINVKINNINYLVINLIMLHELKVDECKYYELVKYYFTNILA